MEPQIVAIFLDIGNTLRIVIDDKPFIAQAKKDLMALVEVRESEEAFFEKLEARWKVYRKQSKETLLEASEKELWTQWLLPDYPPEKIAPLSGKLTRLWRDHDGRRIPRPDVNEVVIELSQRGYLLGILANTITETEIPDWMETEGITRYFKTVILSSKVRIRKPNPEIYLEAARRIGVEPSRCAYVGDNPKRDVEGTRQAGFGMIILIMTPEKLKEEPISEENQPDLIIHEFHQLLDYFPERKAALARDA
jgi:HAD superfamily hydrolase (TIGR01662 family)